MEVTLASSQGVVPLDTISKPWNCRTGVMVSRFPRWTVGFCLLQATVYHDIVLSICLSEIILFIRTWAVWERKLAVGAFLVFQGQCCIVSAVYTILQFMRSTDVWEVEGMTGCLGETRGNLLKSSWGALLASESICLGLLLLKSYKSYRHIYNFSKLFRAVLTDGIVYFILMVGLVMEIIIPTQTRPELDLTLMLSIPSSMLHSIFVAHLVLHLRKVADPERSEADVTITRTLCFGSY